MDSMDNMKKCPQCGGDVQSTAKFCGNCGFRFPVEETAQSSVEKDHIGEVKIPAPPVIEAFSAGTPVNNGINAGMPVPPMNNGINADMSVPPVNSGTNAGTQMPPMNNGIDAGTQIPPVNNGIDAGTQMPPVNSGTNAGTQMPPMNNGINTATPVQPASGNFGAAPTGSQPVYPPYSPVQPPQKKGKGGLIAILSILGVLVLAGLVLVLGVMLGWFRKKEIILSDAKVTVVMGEEVTVEVENYKDLGKPELTAAVQSGKEDYIEVEVKNGEITITGIEEARNITVTVSAKGCEDASFKVTVEEAEEVVEADVDLGGTAWNVEEFRYYFLENKTMYMISEEQEDYIRGTYTVSSITQDDAENYTDGENIGSSVSDGVYFLVEVDVEQELYYGNEYETDDYYLVVCTNGKDCEIYDSGWASVLVGSSAAMESESDLDAYFEASSGGGMTTDPSGVAVAGTVQGISFGAASNVKETWHIAEYASNNGDILIFKKDGNLWGINESGGSAQQLTAVGNDEQVTIFAVYKDYLFYGIGLREEGGEEVFYADTNAFYKVDLANDDVEMISDDIEIKDFVIYDDYIYYTDYSTLYKMDFEGNSEILYDYGVFTFEVTDEYIFVFDGYGDWEVIDPDDGTDYGYILQTDGEYEADVVRYEDEMIFFTVYNYDDTNIYLYAMDYDGNVTQIGGGKWGETWDTYNVVFDDRYVIYTVNGGEVIVKANISTGTCETMSLSDYDYYYATGMVQCGDDVYLYARDYSGNAYYLELDTDDLSVTEIPGVTAQ